MALIGREKEYDAAVQFVIDRATQKHNKVLFVSGACGCGKTSTFERLARHDFASELGSKSVKFDYFNCADMGTKQIWQSFIQCIKARTTKASTAKMTNAQLQALASSVLKAPARRFAVVVLDEVELCKTLAGVRALVHLCISIAAPAVALVLISNARGLCIAPPEATANLTFEAYSVGQLKAIGEQKIIECGGSQVALHPVAAEYAAKTATNQYSGDARKVLCMCNNALRSKKRARELCKEAEATAPATSVDLKDMVSSIHDLPISNTPVISALPPQMLYVLCCAVNCMLRRQSRGDIKSPVITVPEVFSLYHQLMQHLQAPALSITHIRESIQNLADLGLVSYPGPCDRFTICGRMIELQAALKSSGHMFTIAGQIVSATF